MLVPGCPARFVTGKGNGMLNRINSVLRRVGYEIAPSARGTPLNTALPSPTPPKDGAYTPLFAYDGLLTDPKVIHNHDFMRDPRYLKALRAGETALVHDHKTYWRLHVALWCAHRGAHLAGDFVECGVWRGFLSAAILNYIPWPIDGKSFYLFDTFEGLVESKLTDKERENRGKIDHLNSYFANQYDRVKATFAPYANVHLVKGMVPDTLTTVNIDRVCYLSLDLNCAMPELAAAEYFWDRMTPGAALLLDDYGFISYEEQKRVFDDFAKRHGVEILALPTGQGLILRP